MARRKRAEKQKEEFSQELPTGGVEDRPITQVVEVVEEEQPSGEPPTLPVEEEQTDFKEQGEPAGEPLSETPQEEELGKEQKEVVEDLFQKESIQTPTEVAMGNRRGRSGKKSIWWAIIVVGVAVLVGGGLIFLSGRSGGLSGFVAQPTPTPTVTPIPTLAPALSRADLTIQVLNGSGVVGAAGKMRELLEEKGYSVANVGNTDEYTYEETQILVKQDLEAYLTMFKEDLGEEYSIGSTSASLEEDSPYDAQIIVGKE